jgi:hypothetical protein
MNCNVIFAQTEASPKRRNALNALRPAVTLG